MVDMLKSAQSLRVHLVILVLAAVLPLLLFAAVLIHQQIEEEREALQRGMRDTVRALSLAVDREMAISRSVLETLAGAPSIDRGEFETFYRLAQAAAARRSDARIILFDLNGQQLINTIRPYGAALPNTISQAQAAGSDRNYPDLPLGAPDAIKTVIANQQPSISDVFVALSTRRPTVNVAVPVMRGGKLLYVLSMSFEADAFTKLLSEQRLAAGWIAGVFDRRGINFGWTNAPENFVGRPATREILVQLALREDGIGTGHTRDGVPVYHAFARSPVTGWVTAAAVSRAQADAALNRLLLLLWVGGAVLLSLGLGTALYLGRRLAASLTRLSASAGALQRGESVDLKPSHVGEIEVLRQELILAGVQARESALERERHAAAEAARKAIAESEEQFRLLLGGIKNHAIFMLDAGGRITTWNTGAERLIGWNREEAIGQPFSSLYEPVARSAENPHRELLAAAAAEDAPYQQEGLRLRRDGTQFYAHTTLTAVRSAGTLRGYACVIRDISERVRINTALRASEERLQRLIETDAVGVLFYDRSGAIIYANDVFLRTTGYSRAQVERRELNWRGLTPPEWIAESEAQLEQLARTGRLGPYEKEYFMADGTRRWMLFAGRDLGDGTLGEYCIDVHDRKQTEERLRESEARFRTIADSAPVLMWLNDGAGCVYVNRAYLDFLGLHHQIDVRGYDWAQHVHPDDRDAYVGKYIECLNERREFSAELRFRRHDGEYRWMHSVGVPRVSSTGELYGYTGCTYDIHDNKVAVDALREADKRKDDFIAMLSHELRNPLAPIGGAAQILKAVSSNDPKLKWCQELIEKQVAQMSRLMEDLLDMSRITRDKLELRKESVALRSIINAAIETSRPLIEENRHRLIVDLPEEEIRLEGDQVRLAQVFGNLLNNAAKYSEKAGRITLRAEVGAAASGEWRVTSAESGPNLATNHSPLATPHLVVSIKDEGIGIAPEVLPHMFERFYQAESGKERRYGGLGIGLSLVKGIVELHGGSVAARSGGVGKGSEFVVRLPIVACEEEAASGQWRVASEEVVSNDQPPNLTTRHAPLTTSSARKRIVVVDDNRIQAQSLAMLIEMMGFDSKYALSGADALKLIAEYKPQAALIDIGLPDMPGYEVAQRLRALHDLKGITLIAQTGWGRDEDREHAKEAGFDHHLTKPIDHQLLETLLTTLADTTRVN